MCLYTMQIKPEVAVIPIRCLKVVRRNKDGYFPLYFYDKVTYHIGETVTDDCFKKESENGGRLYEVYYGFHTYTSGNHNVKELYFNYFKEDVWNGVALVVVECEIPVGALYYKGYSNCIHPLGDADVVTEIGYVSDKLKIVRELSEEEINALNE